MYQRDKKYHINMTKKNQINCININCILPAMVHFKIFSDECSQKLQQFFFFSRTILPQVKKKKKKKNNKIIKSLNINYNHPMK